MSQIVKRRKKGRPSKADLARRKSSSPADRGYELRRSLRRRNVRYNFDFDDYLDDDDDEDEMERRREKKMKLVLKLNQSRASADPPARSRGRPAARGRHASDDEGEEDEDEAEGEEEGEEDPAPEEEEEEEDDDDDDDDDEDGNEKKPVKKRKINGGVEEDKDYEEEEEEDRAEVDEDDDEERKDAGKKNGSVPGEQFDRRSATPMPDKKTLELILDKLQKKDVYGVYAEPVDPEELPDYHDIIEHPMDFATVRKKLANGSYPILEEFESDVFLICWNAMEYNAPDTVYYKQARTIQEMAKKKFEKVRIKIERSEKELKTDQKVKPSTVGKKQVKQPLSRNVLEPVGSDFSSGANLASGGAVQNGSISTQTGGYEKHNYMDGLLESNNSLVDNLEKAEEWSSGKGVLGKFGRKLPGVDENRRATYIASIQPADRSESIFSTFEGEIKQLVAVGLHAEHAYARSLARFAATLGPSAWKVASKRIEQALPTGYKFGRGWVGEYEPLPTPVLLIETRTHKEPFMFLKPQSNAVTKKNQMPCKALDPVKEQPTDGHAPQRNPCLFQTSAAAVSMGAPSSVSPQAVKSNSAGQRQNSLARTFVEPQNKIPRQVELNLPPSNEQNYPGFATEKQSVDKSETMALRSSNMMRNMSFTQSEHYKPLATNGICPGAVLPDGKVSSGSNSRMIDWSADTASQMARVATFSQPSRQNQGRSDPVQLTEKAKMLQNSSSHPLNASSPVSSISSIRTEDSSNAAVAAARAWMSIGAGAHKQVSENSNSPKSQISADSLYIPARELHAQALRPRANTELPFPSPMQFHPQRNGFPFQTFVQQPVHGMVNGAQLQSRPMAFPQLVPTSDFTRFQVQSSPWRGVTSHVQLKQKQDNLPPDLNIGVQSPDSPAKQSSGVRVDSQQPDLALQL